MKKTLVIVFLLTISQLSLASDIDLFTDKLMNFYLDASRENFVSLQGSANDYKDDFKQTEVLLGVTIAVISKKHGWPILEGHFGELASEIVKGESDFAQFVASDEVVSPLKIDIWWASFFASGDELYLDKIFQYAGIEVKEDDVKQNMVVNSASWSFKANSKQHLAVKEFAVKKSRIKEISATKLEYLKDCIKFAEEKA